MCFPDSVVTVFPRTELDHHPIQLQTRANHLQRGKKPFRVLAAWLLHEEFKYVFDAAWIPYSHHIPDAIENVGKEAKQWNRSVFGNIFKKKKDVTEELEKLQKLPFLSQIQTMRQTELITSYKHLLRCEELIWFQKSRVDWLSKGDLNTKFYHASTLVRRGRNCVLALKVDGDSWSYEEETLREFVTNHFRMIYLDDRTSHNDSATVGVHPTLTATEAQLLTKSVTMEEVRNGLFDMSPWKSPGPDGIQAAFFQENWNTVAPGLFQLV